MKSKEELIKEIKLVDRKIDKFMNQLWKEHPDLGLGCTGCVRLNSYKILMGDEIAKKTLGPRLYKRWLERKP